MVKQDKTHTEILAEARSRSGGAFVGEVQFYCDNPACPARQVKVWTKEYGTRVPIRVLCPYCGGTLQTDHALTVWEYGRRHNTEKPPENPPMPIPLDEYMRRREEADERGEEGSR